MTNPPAVDAERRRDILAWLTGESIDLGLYDWAPPPCCLDVGPEELAAVRERVEGLVATAERRRQPGFRWRAGDRVLVALTDTGGRDTMANVVVNRAEPLGCGCVRLVCDRPGEVPAPDGVCLLTGCVRHPREC